jgi:hypothetical protein
VLQAEAEIALILSADRVGLVITRADVEAAIASMCAAIEIGDSRFADWKITFADTFADNGSSAISSGNIGTDLMIKVMRLTSVLEIGAFVGIYPESDGFKKVERMGVAIRAGGKAISLCLTPPNRR